MMELQGELKLKADSRTKSLADKTKSKLLKRINKSPGIRYIELLRVALVTLDQKPVRSIAIFRRCMRR